MKPPASSPCPFVPGSQSPCGQNANHASLMPVCQCSQLSSQVEDLGLKIMCISFSSNEQPVAMLYCFLPTDYHVTDRQEVEISSIAPILSDALYRARLNDPAVLRYQAIQEERGRIIKDLHDTIAQDLFYVCLKLDQVSQFNDRDLVRLITVKEDLADLQNIANKAYVEIRQIINTLEHEPHFNLPAAITEYARLTASRAGFLVNFETKGTRMKLPEGLSTEIFNIFREVLANIEFHAKASEVNIDQIWTPEYYALQIIDNGLGFDMEKADLEEHYGLKIIHKRAAEMNAQFELVSAPGKGTQVKLLVPLKAANEPARTETFRWVNSIKWKAGDA